MSDAIDRTEEWDRLRADHSAQRTIDPRRRHARPLHRLSSTSRPSASTRPPRVPADRTVREPHYPGSTHFFFDIGNGNSLAFFDFPGLDLGPYAEAFGSKHHLAISMDPDTHARIKQKIYDGRVTADFEHLTSIYSGPDGERLELIADDLGHMYGEDPPAHGTAPPRSANTGEQLRTRSPGTGYPAWFVHARASTGPLATTEGGPMNESETLDEESADGAETTEDVATVYVEKHRRGNRWMHWTNFPP